MLSRVLLLCAVLAAASCMPQTQPKLPGELDFLPPLLLCNVQMFLLTLCSPPAAKRYAVACPNQNPLLECPEGQMIELLSVDHGLTTSDTVCGTTDKPQPLVRDRCLNIAMNPWSKFICDKMQRCRLPKPDRRMFDCLYDDDTFLQVTYMCVMRRPGSKTVVKCDGQDAQLKCDEGVIRIIKASYGRFDGTTCTDTPSVMTFCSSNTADMRVKEIGEELPRDAVLSWFRERILDGLGLQEGPPERPDGHAVSVPRRVARSSQAAGVHHGAGPPEETSETILFPRVKAELISGLSLADSVCTRSDPGPGEPSSLFTYHFQPSTTNHRIQITSADFWFYAGAGGAGGAEGAAVNSSSQLFLLTSAQQLLQAAEAPSAAGSDGWTTFILDHNLLGSLGEGPFALQVHCPSCRCLVDPDLAPFLHLHVEPRRPVRAPRSAPLTIPWSPSVIDLLQRPSQDVVQHGDCHRAEVDISFEELGWDNWIVHPKVLTFYYCHGNCSAWGRSSALLGISQCCAPVPGSMRSLRITTTSDGGYSFKYETLPNIIPEECTCF
ncbi:uncharacterized protein V6R79_001670 [Siganus canaliculatus]